MNELETAQKSKNSFRDNLDNYIIFDEEFNTNSVLYETFFNYAFLQKPDLQGKYLEKYLFDLKQDVVEYFEENKAVYNFETLLNLAYFRLKKASEQYSLLKNYVKDEKKLTDVTKKAKQYKEEFELVLALKY
ncbi:MAG: hypothetical protein PHX18_04915 [Candidatus Gastranaerophilales bacterium]|nr:hypothetical protein [Candidatus Gastranaerophilales bacterium]